ncbi:hypothetical protein GPU89_11690 [Burkholderia cepacia]|nr:hypothetical protein [Burkholderia cepacia]
MAELLLVNVEEHARDDEVGAFLARHGFPLFDAIERVPAGIGTPSRCSGSTRCRRWRFTRCAPGSITSRGGAARFARISCRTGRTERLRAAAWSER